MIQRYHRFAFTLIELLVVIAIISVLASILLPSLSAARDRAKTVSCASRLKQVTMMAEFYREENDDWYVCSNVWDPRITGGGPALTFYRQLTPYLDRTMLSKNQNDGPDTSFMIDPGTQYQHDPSAGAAQWSLRKHGYFLGTPYAMWSYWVPTALGYGNFAPSNVPPPNTKTPYMTNEISVYVFETETDWSEDSDSLKFNHGRGTRMNIAYTDGHVELHSYPLNKEPYPPRSRKIYDYEPVKWW